MANNEYYDDKEDKIAFVERKRWGFFGLPFTFTVYYIGEEMLTIDSGFFNKKEDDCYMYKIQDAKMTRTLFERMFGTGTITCYTGDVTDKVLILKHIKHTKEVKDYILKTSEKSRIKRRTMNMQNIGVDADSIPEGDLDGFLDN